MSVGTVKCIACADEIQAEAKLCKHCGTLQNDPRFVEVASLSVSKSLAGKVAKLECLRCQKELKTSENVLCVECIENLDDVERHVFEKGKNVALCPKCELFIYNSAKSTFCYICTRDAEPQNSNLWISWWLQSLFVIATFFLPVNFTDARVFLLNVGGQLFSWNVILSIAFGVAFLVLRKRAKQYRLRSWFYSTLTFGGVGLFMLIFVMIMIANQGKS